MRWWVSVCVSTRERNQFPSVLLQPLGHLSVFRINRLRAVEHLIIAHARRVEARSSITFRFSGLKRAQRCASRKLCQTTQSLAIGYCVWRRDCHSIDLSACKGLRDYGQGAARRASARWRPDSWSLRILITGPLEHPHARRRVCAVPRPPNVSASRPCRCARDARDRQLWSESRPLQSPRHGAPRGVSDHDGLKSVHGHGCGDALREQRTLLRPGGPGAHARQHPRRVDCRLAGLDGRTEIRPRQQLLPMSTTHRPNTDVLIRPA